jgi:glutaredoxin 3
MQAVEIYTKDYCPYCHKAKALLVKKGVAFKEFDVTHDPAGQKAMTGRANGRSTVPQVFIGTRHVGGCDDLHEAEARGLLDKWLAA